MQIADAMLALGTAETAQLQTPDIAATGQPSIADVKTHCTRVLMAFRTQRKLGAKGRLDKVEAGRLVHAELTDAFE